MLFLRNRQFLYLKSRNNFFGVSAFDLRTAKIFFNFRQSSFIKYEVSSFSTLTTAQTIIDVSETIYQIFQLRINNFE